MSISVEINWACGEIGKLASLRNWWLKTCRFKSDHAHQQKGNENDRRTRLLQKFCLFIFKIYSSRIVSRINDECCTSGKGKVALVVVSSPSVRLRKKCHLSHTFTCAYNVANTLPIYSKSISTHVHNSKQLKQLGHATMHLCIQIGTKDDNTITTS